MVLLDASTVNSQSPRLARPADESDFSLLRLDAFASRPNSSRPSYHSQTARHASSSTSPLAIKFTQSMPRALLAARVFAASHHKAAHLEPLGPPIAQCSNTPGMLTSYVQDILTVPLIKAPPRPTTRPATQREELEAASLRPGTSPTNFAPSAPSVPPLRQEMARSEPQHSSPGLPAPPRYARSHLAGRPMASPTGSTCGTPRVVLNASTRLARDAAGHGQHVLHGANAGGTSMLTHEGREGCRGQGCRDEGHGCRGEGHMGDGHRAVVLSAPYESDLVASIASQPIFACLTREELVDLLSRGERRAFPRYATVLRTGRVDTALFVVLSGSVHCRVDTPAPSASREREATAMAPATMLPPAAAPGTSGYHTMLPLSVTPTSPGGGGLVTICAGETFGEAALLGEASPCDVLAGPSCEVLCLDPSLLANLPIDVEALLATAPAPAEAAVPRPATAAPPQSTHARREARRARLAARPRGYTPAAATISPRRTLLPPGRASSQPLHDEQATADALRKHKMRSADTALLLRDYRERFLRSPRATACDVTSPRAMRPAVHDTPQGNGLLQSIHDASIDRSRGVWTPRGAAAAGL